MPLLKKVNVQKHRFFAHLKSIDHFNIRPSVLITT